jgi:murein DD-endopeptidase MepM/ murein hydrolase activator NlpD
LVRFPLLLGVLVGAFFFASASSAKAAVFADAAAMPGPAEVLSVDFLTTFAEALAQVRVEPLPTPEPPPFALEWPAVGELTDEFGPRWGRLHAGIDIGILRKLRVVAAADGRVSAAGYLPGYAGYGLVVVVDHRDGHETLYAHLSRVDVRQGEWVRGGRPLGLAGCTGSCTGTHLHFELHKRGRAVDPLLLLR